MLTDTTFRVLPLLPLRCHAAIFAFDVIYAATPYFFAAMLICHAGIYVHNTRDGLLPYAAAACCFAAARLPCLSLPSYAALRYAATPCRCLLLIYALCHADVGAMLHMSHARYFVTLLPSIDGQLLIIAAMLLRLRLPMLPLI